MAHYGVVISVDEGRASGYLSTYSFVVDTTAQVRELLLTTTAPIVEVTVTEEGYGQPNRTMSAEEVLAITLNHPRREALSLA